MDIEKLAKQTGFAEHPVQPREEHLSTNPNSYKPRHSRSKEDVERIARTMYERYARPGRSLHREWSEISDRDHWIRLTEFVLEAIEIHPPV